MSVDGPRIIVGEDGSSSGLYHFTRSDAGRVWPIGYCSSVRQCPEYPECEAEQPPCDCGGIGLIRTLETCAGHATPQEAEAHFRLWAFDNARYDGRRGERQQCLAPDCRTLTRGHALVADVVYTLCPKHLNRSTLAIVLGMASEAQEVEDVGTDEVVDG